MASEFLTAREAVDVVASVHPALPVGCLHLEAIDVNKSAKVYFKDGLIYAIEVSGYNFPILNRLVSSSLIDEVDRSYILRQLDKRDECHPRIFSIAIGNQLVGHEEMSSVLRENFVACATEVFSWQEVNAQWVADEYTENFTVEFVNVLHLFELIDRRVQTMNSILQMMQVDKSIFHYDLSKNVSPSSITDQNSSLSFESSSILSLLRGGSNLDEVSAKLGMTRYVLMKDFFLLWQSKFISFDEDLSKLSTTVDAPVVEVIEEKALEEAKILIEHLNADVSTSVSSMYYTVLKELADHITESEDTLNKTTLEVELQKDQLSKMKELDLDVDSEEDIAEQENYIQQMEMRLKDERTALEQSYQRFISLNAMLSEEDTKNS